MKKFSKLQEYSERQWNELRDKINEEEYFTKETEIQKKEILELKNSISEMKHWGRGEAYQMEEKINELNDRNINMFQVEEEREWRFFFLKWRNPIRTIDSIWRANVRLMGIPEERKKGAECI